MLDLPILNVPLGACFVAAEHLTPTAQGHFCTSCQRTVHDFTAATQADLAAARAAAPDGRVCGRYRAGQLASVQPLVPLRPRLRRFLVALVLVCGLGLTSREAWAQLRQAPRFEPTTTLQLKTPRQLNPLTLTEAEPPKRAKQIFMGVEIMPTFKGGTQALQAYLKQHLHYPDSTTASGQVFVSFLVTKTGAITNARVVKGVDPRLDAAALRVVRYMPAWQPGQFNQHPTEVTFTLPITFIRE